MERLERVSVSSISVGEELPEMLLEPELGPVLFCYLQVLHLTSLFAFAA
jgi:hypothetical protein